MAKPVQIASTIITKGMETRLKDNNFQLILEGYYLYPMESPITVKREEKDVPIGEGIINSLEFSKGNTKICYTLTTLKSIN